MKTHQLRRLMQSSDCTKLFYMTKDAKSWKYKKQSLYKKNDVQGRKQIKVPCWGDLKDSSGCPKNKKTKKQLQAQTCPIHWPFRTSLGKLHPDKQDVSSFIIKQVMRLWSESICKMDKDEKIGSRSKKRPDLCLSAPGLSVWKLWVCVLRQNQFQFASTSHCGVNNGGLVANMQSMMDHDHNDIMT